MKTLIILVVLVMLAGAIYMAYRSSKNEAREAKTLSKLPPSVQHVVSQMDGTTQAAFFNEYWAKRRKASAGYLLWFFFGCHYLYAKKVGVQFAFWLLWLVGVGELWWIVDFFRIPRIMADGNEQIARQCLQTLQIAASYGQPVVQIRDAAPEIQPGVEPSA